MTQLVGLVVVCMTLVVAVFSCSQASVEQTRVIYAAKQSCFDAGGNWNSWTSVCNRHTPSKEQ